MEDIKLILKGFIIGIGKIIPGVSGAMFAMMFGLYEKALHVISHLKTDLLKNLKFILILGISIFLAIVFGSNIIKICLDKYYLSTMLLFIGMMVGGIKPLFKNVKGEKIKLSNIFCAIIVVILLTLLSLLDIGDKTNYLAKTPLVFFMLILAGFIDAMATVIPGICGTALLMIIGYYDTIISALGDIFNFSNIGNNMFVLIPFVIGLISGILLISKLVDYLFKNHRTKTYYAIIGFAITSILLLFKDVLTKSYNLTEIIISIVLFVIGFIIVNSLENKKIKK